MSKIGSQEFQEHSEIDLFNKIGFMAETLGYNPVYFKALKPMLMETEKDHVHLLISCDPQYGIHKVVKGLKGFSARVLRENFPHLKSSMPSMWTNSYFCATVGSVSLDVVKQYIENQQVRSKNK